MFEALAKALDRFSFDLVSICAEYAREPRFWRLFDCDFDSPNSIAVSSDNEVYVCDDTRVQVFSADGNFLRRLKPVTKPRCVAFTHNGCVLVGDREGPYRVLLFDRKGALLSGFAGVADTLNPLLPTGICEFENNAFVCCQRTHSIEIVPLTGKGIQPFSGNVRLKEPFACCVHDGVLYVTDTGLHKVLSFRMKARYDSLKSAPSLGPFHLPAGLAVRTDAMAPHPGSHLLVCASHRVHAVGFDNTFLWSFGSEGERPGQLKYPLGVAVGPDMKIYVVDASHRLSVFVF